MGFRVWEWFGCKGQCVEGTGNGINSSWEGKVGKKRGKNWEKDIEIRSNPKIFNCKVYIYLLFLFQSQILEFAWQDIQSFDFDDEGMSFNFEYIRMGKKSRRVKIFTSYVSYLIISRNKCCWKKLWGIVLGGFWKKFLDIILQLLIQHSVQISLMSKNLRYISCTV